MPLEAFPLSVHVQDYRDAGDHIEFGLLVRHTCGMRWQVWRRFSSFEDVHLRLQKATNNDGRLPEFPRKGWMPHFMQAAQQLFCQQRAAELQRYLDAVLRYNIFAKRGDILDLLGLKQPEPPSGLRVIRRECGAHDLEVRPSKDSEAAPVESYNVSLRHQEGDNWQTDRSFTCVIGEEGMRQQVIQLGRLQVGTHEVTVTASNLAGESSSECVAIIVDDAVAFSAPLQVDDKGLGPRQARVRLPCQTRLLPRGRLLPDARSGVAPVVPSEGCELEKCRATMPANQSRRDQPASAGLASWVASTSQLPQGSLAGSSRRDPQAPYHKPASPYTGTQIQPSPAALAVALPSTDEDILNCVICLATPKTHAFVPCGHRCVCEKCSQAILSAGGQEALCPLCRAAVQDAMHIFD
mmetsp:Transcript_35631/g.80456  ORF Transcript_35631/g.80456 Transcript_35631/m.80456 type:complete len:409 (+) Transcript_35631:155-1381(+)